MKRCTKCGEAKPATRESFHSDRTKSDALATTCKACKKANARRYYQTHAAELIAQQRDYHARDPERWRAYKAAYYQRTKEKSLAQAHARQPERTQRQRERYHGDPEYRARKLACQRAHRERVGVQAMRDRQRRAHERYKAKLREMRERIGDAAFRALRQRQIETHLRLCRKWERKHKDELRVRARVRYYADWEHRREQQRAWESRNPARMREIRRAARSRRRARQRGADGSATRAQIEARVAFYGGRCWMCGAEWQSIDHVIPLSRGGSNWPANLRPACARCNKRKHARKPSEMSDLTIPL